MVPFKEQNIVLKSDETDTKAILITILRYFKKNKKNLTLIKRPFIFESNIEAQIKENSKRKILYSFLFLSERILFYFLI